MKYIIGKNRRKKRSKPASKGTSISPRLSVFRSNRYVYVQAIDDINGITVASSSSMQIKVKSDLTKIEEAKEIGIDLAGKLKKLKIKNAYFDRAGYRYHGRVRAIADGVRESGVII